MGRIRPATKISTPDYIGTGDSHNHTSSQSHRFIIPLPSRPNGNRTAKLRVRVKIAADRVGSINACCVWSTIRYANWGLNERTGEMLIKNFAQLLFPFFFLPFSPSFSQGARFSKNLRKNLGKILRKSYEVSKIGPQHN